MVVEVYILGIACMFYLLVNPSETSNFADTYERLPSSNTTAVRLFLEST